MSSYDELAADAPDWFAGIALLVKRGKNDEALRQAREKRVACKESADKPGQLAANRLIVKVQAGKGDGYAGIQTATEAVDLAKTTKDKKLIAGATHSLALAQVKGGKLDEAEASAKEAAKAYKDVKFEKGEAAVMITMASLQFAKKKFDEAGQTAQEATEKFKQLGDPAGQAASLQTSIDMKMNQKRVYHALLLVEQMAALHREASDAEGEAAAQLMAAELEVSQGEAQNAVDRASSSAELFERIGDSRSQASAYLVLAKAFISAGQLEDACQFAEAACVLCQEGKDKRGLAGALFVCATTYSVQEKYLLASNKLSEAGFIYRGLKDRKGEAKAMTLLATTQIKLFDNVVEMPMQGWTAEEREDAAKNAGQAVGLLGDTGKKKSSEYGQALVAHARLLLSSNNAEEAVKKANEAKTLFESLGDKGGLSEAFLVLGSAFQGQKKADEALDAFEKAREFAHDAGQGGSVKDVSKKIKDIGRYKAKKAAGGADVQDVTIMRPDMAVYDYTAFECRTIKTGAGPGGKSSSATPDDPSYAVQKQKVMYNLRMQRVPAVEMTYPGLEIQEAITA